MRQVTKLGAGKAQYPDPEPRLTRVPSGLSLKSFGLHLRALRLKAEDLRSNPRQPSGAILSQ
jgi:hypothetical protein